MNVLVINAGSSSFKYQLLDMRSTTVLCSGLVERIGDPMGRMAHKIAPDTDREEKILVEQLFASHTEGMRLVVDTITDPVKGVIKHPSEVGAIGHRVVMGGETIKESVLITDSVKQLVRDNFALSPLHNPANLAGIEVAERLFPGVPNVGVFDTEFHQTMPETAYLYPLPYALYEELRIRRYGYHGTSHRYVTGKAAEVLGRPVDSVNLITCHLGNGCSITAVKDGRSADTSMGMTPLEGLMMGTRCGDIDPAIVPYLITAKGMSAQQVDALMNKQSGLKGICGLNDMRDIHAACENGDAAAVRALGMFAYRIRKYIGAYFAVLGRVDGVVFTAGIGENDSILRARVCENMEHMGIVLDSAANAGRSSEPRLISKPGSKVPVLVVPTNEELAIARTTMRIVGAAGSAGPAA
jgi:acetate kinase